MNWKKIILGLIYLILLGMINPFGEQDISVVIHYRGATAGTVCEIVSMDTQEVLKSSDILDDRAVFVFQENDFENVTAGICLRNMESHPDLGIQGVDIMWHNILQKRIDAQELSGYVAVPGFYMISGNALNLFTDGVTSSMELNADFLNNIKGYSVPALKRSLAIVFVWTILYVIIATGISQVCALIKRRKRYSREIDANCQKRDMKKKVYGLISMYFIVPFVGMALLWLVHMIPVDKMMENVINSGDYIYNSQNNINNALADTNLDRWTNSLMINESICQTSENALIRALKANYYITGDLASDTPYETLLSVVWGRTDTLNIASYERYWHGYLVFLKPLLYFFSIDEIIYLNIILHFLCVFAVIILLEKQGMEKLIFPYFVFYLSLSPTVVAYSFQYSTIYYIVQLALIIFLKWRKQIEEKELYIFFFSLLGMMTSYFDFLTYPIVSLGIPLLFVIMIERQKIINVIKYSILWGCGYGGMWFSKWILGSLFLNENLVRSALGSVKFRSSSMGTDSSTKVAAMEVIRNNAGIYSNGVYILLFAVLIICLLLLIVKIVVAKYQIDRGILVSIAVVSAYPFAWYFMVKNHSYIHSWMTFRDMSIFFTAIAAMIIFLKMSMESHKNDNEV